MQSITATSDLSYYQIFMEPAEDSPEIRELLHIVQECAQEGFFQRHFVTTGYAILIWAKAFFETIKFSGRCLQACFIEIWYLDFSEVKEHFINDSLDCLQSIKYTICMPFVIFCGLLLPGFFYSPLIYPQCETRELQNLRVELEAAQQGEVEREQLQSELDTERANCLSARAEVQDLRATLAAVPQERERLRSEIEAQTREEIESQARGELELAEERIQGLESKVSELGASIISSEEEQNRLLDETRESEQKVQQLLETTKEELRKANKKIEGIESALEVTDDYSKQMKLANDNTQKKNKKARKDIIELKKQLEIAEESKRTFGILADQLAEITKSRLDPGYEGDLHSRLREIRVSSQKPMDRDNPRMKLAEALLKNAEQITDPKKKKEKKKN